MLLIEKSMGISVCDVTNSPHKVDLGFMILGRLIGKAIHLCEYNRNKICCYVIMLLGTIRSPWKMDF